MSANETDAAVPIEADAAAPAAAPTKSDPVVPVVVVELIEESETIQGWVERLADHADGASREVLERVQEDYHGRLEGISGQLAKHRPELVSSLEGREATVESLRSNRDSHTADLEEARLRHSVGEFSEPKWNSRRTTIETLIDELDSQLEVEDGAVSELTAALARIKTSGPPSKTVAFTSEGFVEVDRTRVGNGVGSGVARNGSWSKVLSETKKEGHSAPVVRGPVAEGNGQADSDELDFIDAVSKDDLERLDPIAAALRSRGN